MSSANTRELNENGEGLCNVCKRKFKIQTLELCMCCDKWCCTSHRGRSKKISGAYICSNCMKYGE